MNKPVAGFNAHPENINRNGAPKKEWTWSGLIREHMEKLGADGKAVKDAVTASLVAKALEGDVVAIKEIGNRIDGMPEQSVTNKGTLDITYKPIMGATASVSSNEGVPQITQSNQTD